MVNPSNPPRTFDPADFPEQQLTGLIIACEYHVHRTFGFGFLESVYRRARVEELRYRGATVDEERRFRMTQRAKDVGVFKADVLVEDRVIVEVKTGLLPNPTARVQLLNYLCCSNVELGLNLDFCPELHIKRTVKSEKAKGARFLP